MSLKFSMKNYDFIIFWISIVILSLTHVSTSHRTHLKTTRTFTIGKCIWVTNRTCPDIDINFYLFTRDNLHDRQYIHIDKTWETSNLSDSNFNPFIPNKIIIHGYNSDMFLNPLIQMKNEYLLRGYYNLFFVDWSVLAPGPCYIMAVHNIRHVGACVAQLVERILDVGNRDIHLIGFSLGGQVPNFVAQNLHDYKLERITGLDPALPLFVTADIDEKLDPTDAEFVDVIHTNALVQGKIERCGHVDFYMNGGIVQPGCFQLKRNPFACSHQRAPDYFSESINSQKGFWGWACSSYINFLLGMCPPTNYQVLAGEDCNPDTRNGMYLINTNKRSPFAIGKWTDLSDHSLFKLKTQFPTLYQDPLLNLIDKWGKLDGDFNNKISDYEDDYDYGEYILHSNFVRQSAPRRKYNYKEILRNVQKTKENIKTLNFRNDLMDSIKVTTEIYNDNAGDSSSEDQNEFLTNFDKMLINRKKDPEVLSLPVVLDNK